MIDVKEAAKKAMVYFNDLFKDAGYINVSLEELELSSDETIGLSP